MAEHSPRKGIENFYPKKKFSYSKMVEMYAAARLELKIARTRLYKVSQWLHDEKDIAKRGDRLKEISENRIPHLVALSVAMINKICPELGGIKGSNMRANMLYVILYAIETKFEVIGESFWLHHVQRRAIPTKMKFSSIMRQLVKHGYFERTLSRYSGKNNYKTARYFITQKGKKTGQDIIDISKLLHTVGITSDTKK